MSLQAKYEFYRSLIPYDERYYYLSLEILDLINDGV